MTSMRNPECGASYSPWNRKPRSRKPKHPEKIISGRTAKTINSARFKRVFAVLAVREHPRGRDMSRAGVRCGFQTLWQARHQACVGLKQKQHRTPKGFASRRSTPKTFRSRHPTLNAQQEKVLRPGNLCFPSYLLFEEAGD